MLKLRITESIQFSFSRLGFLVMLSRLFMSSWHLNISLSSDYVKRKKKKASPVLKSVKSVTSLILYSQSKEFICSKFNVQNCSVWIICCCSVTKPRLTLWFQELQNASLPYPSPSPGICSNSCPLSHWCHTTISSSIPPFSSCPQTCPASGFFFPNEWALHIRWPNYWSFSISPSNKYSELISFRIDWLDLLSVQGTLPITIWSACILHFSFAIVQKIYWAPTTIYQTLFWNLGEQWKKPTKIPVPMQPKELKH